MTDGMAALLADEMVLGRRVAELILESDPATWAMLATLTAPEARLVG